jgi:outer membrane protein assembly factor BamD (BamD/ComL family)
MARLRREEEARAYEKMINPQPAAESFAQRFPTSPHAKLFLHLLGLSLKMRTNYLRRHQQTNGADHQHHGFYCCL